MSSNGAYGQGRDREQQVYHEDQTRDWALLSGVGTVEGAITHLVAAAEANQKAAYALSAVASHIAKIRSDTARSISDTTAIRRALKDVTDREQELREQLEQLRAERRKPSLLALPSPSSKIREVVEKVVKRRKRGKRAA